MPEEKNIYVEVTVKAIRDGSVYSQTINQSPNQTKSTFTKMEMDMADLLKSWGALSLGVDPGKK